MIINQYHREPPPNTIVFKERKNKGAERGKEGRHPQTKKATR
jgi:hypothetical protein